MRVIARPDFDGIVCAVLLNEALDIDEPVLWVEPNVMQSGTVEVRKGDVIANLSYHKNCTLWFDHHESNQLDIPFTGLFKIAPSAAGNIFEFFNNFDPAKYPEDISKHVRKFRRDFSKLVAAADKIDSAKLSLDEILHPEKYPCVSLSMTVISHKQEDSPYWDRLVELLRKYDIPQVIEDQEVKTRCSTVIEESKKYKKLVKKHTVLKEHVSITDFRSFKIMPTGNRFLVFSLFPESGVNIKIRYHNEDRNLVIVSVGHSIFNDKCNVSAGLLCSRYGGGGHRGAGSCSFPTDKAEENINTIIEVLLKNEI
jgi:hypothetical protein